MNICLLRMFYQRDKFSGRFDRHLAMTDKVFFVRGDNVITTRFRGAAVLQSILEIPKTAIVNGFQYRRVLRPRNGKKYANPFDLGPPHIFRRFSRYIPNGGQGMESDDAFDFFVRAQLNDLFTCG